MSLGWKILGLVKGKSHKRDNIKWSLSRKVGDSTAKFIYAQFKITIPVHDPNIPFNWIYWGVPTSNAHHHNAWVTVKWRYFPCPDHPDQNQTRAFIIVSHKGECNEKRYLDCKVWYKFSLELKLKLDCGETYCESQVQLRRVISSLLSKEEAHRMGFNFRSCIVFGSLYPLWYKLCGMIWIY